MMKTDSMTVNKLLLAYGQGFVMNEKTFAGKRKQSKMCFMNSYRLATNNSNFTYVEGQVDIGPFPIEHAWVVNSKGQIFDPTLTPPEEGQTIYPHGYFGIPFKTDYIMKVALRSGVYGILLYTNRDLSNGKDSPSDFLQKFKCIRINIDMHLRQLFESHDRKTLVIFGGGFQPLTPNHLYVYNYLKQQFTDADIFLASTNNTKERPFNFKQKQYLATQAGISKDRFVEVVSPYKAQEITKNYDPANTILIFALSSKDAERLGKPIKKDGSLAYIQPYSSSKSEPLKTFNTHGYYVIVPATSFQIGSESINSASLIRKMYAEGSENDRAGIIRALYPNSKNFAKIKSIMDDVLVKKKIDEGIFQKPILLQYKRDEIYQELYDHFNLDDQYILIEISDKKMDKLHLGTTLWANHDVLRNESGPVIYGIIINPDACRDEKIYKAVLAHELCHVEDLLTNYFPVFEQLNIDERNELIEKWRSENKGHGASWLKIANRINRIFGPNYVTPYSDNRFKYNLLGNVKSGKLFKESKKK